MASAVKSLGLLFILCSLSLVSGVIYIDKVIQESNSAVTNLTLTYTHDASGDSLTSVIFQNFVTISKMLVYFTVRIADNKDNIGVTRDLVKTVIDLEKLSQGSQANPLVKAYFENIWRCMDFTLKFPLLPGTYKLLNITTDGPILRLLPNTKGSIDFRFVGKYGSNKKMRYIGHVAVSGGFRKT